MDLLYWGIFKFSETFPVLPKKSFSVVHHRCAISEIMQFFCFHCYDQLSDQKTEMRTIKADYQSLQPNGSENEAIFDSKYDKVDDETLGAEKRWNINTVTTASTLIITTLIVSLSFMCIQIYGSSTSRETNLSLNPELMYLKSSTDLFTLESSAFLPNGTLPDIYTCKGGIETGISPPLNWSNAPVGTTDFVVTMKKESGYSWCLYNIENRFSELLANNTEVGTFGGTAEFSSTDKHVTKFAYDEPCSKGPGVRDYTFEVFAFSESVNSTLSSMGISDEEINPILILDTMGDKLLGIASLICHFTLY